MIDTEKKYGLKLSHAIALFVIFILNVIRLVCVVTIFDGHLPIDAWISIILFAAAAMYACYGYKQAHGNHMRYLLLINAVIVACLLALGAKTQPTYMIISYLVGIIMITYMAGRLSHYKQNLVICFIVLICNIINAFYFISLSESLSFEYVMASFGSVTVWLAIAGAYITRYKLHKEAGFEDKK